MIIKQGTETQKIKDDIASVIDKGLSKKDYVINFERLDSLATLISFLVNSNEVSVYFDLFGATENQIMISASGSYIGFSFKEPNTFSELLEQVGANSLQCHNNANNMLSLDIVIPSVFIRGDEHE